MRIFKRLMEFISLNILVIFLIHFALIQPSVRRIQFSDIHNDNYSIISVGQSHSETGIDPYILSEENNKAYNLSRRLTSINNIYYIIKEANRDSNLKKVYMEIDSGYWNEGSSRIWSCTDTNLIYSLSLRYKTEYLINELMMQNYNDAIFDYYFDFSELHKIPNNIKVKINKKYINCSEDAIEYMDSMNEGTSYKYKGRGFRYGYKQNNVEYLSLYKFKSESVNKDLMKIFEKICRYCDNNNIELICFVSALPPYRLINENHGDVHDFFENICKKNNVKFIDLNYAKSEYLCRTDDDYVDIDGHMMGPLAQRQTRILKEISNSNNPEQYFYDTYDEVLEGLKVKNGDAA